VCRSVYGGGGGWALFAGRAECDATLPEVVEVMRRVLLCMLEVGICLLEVLAVSEVPEVMRCVLLCMLEVFEALEAMEEMRCVPLCIWRLWRVGSGYLMCWTCRM